MSESKITVNGVVTALQASTLAALLATSGIGPNARFVAVALNGIVVPRARWADTVLAAGDSIEIIKPMAGG